MAKRFTPPITQLVNSDASGVASGWKLNFYDTGTTERKDTFSDSALTTANANPVVADSAGRFGDIFLEAGTYKVVLTDADDVEIWTGDPDEGATGSSGAVITKTGDYTVTIADQSKIIAVDASSGAVTITLLASATAGDGFEVTVKKTDSSTNAVTVDGNGSETIDGATTDVLRVQQQSVSVRSDASNWQVLSRNNPFGRRTMFIYPGMMASAAAAETTTGINNKRTKTFNFDQTTEENAQFAVNFPKAWDGGTVTFQYLWIGSGSGETLTMGLKAFAAEDGDAVDGTYGTEVKVTDTCLTVGNSYHLSDESAAVTIGGSPAKNVPAHFEFTRDVATDNLGEDAKIVELRIYYNVDAPTDD